MQMLQRDKARWRVAARLSMISAILSVFMAVGSILLLWYIPMGISIAVAVHGFYFTPFYFRKYEDLSRTEIIFTAIVAGITEKCALAERARVSECYLESLVANAERRGYFKM